MDTPGYAVDVRSILEDLGGSFVLDSRVELPTIVLGAESFTPLQPAQLTADITNTGTGVVASGTITAVLEATCSRCLRVFPLTIVAPLEGFYVAPGHDDEIPEEQEVGPIFEGNIDLMDQILSALALELPFAPLHSEECPGICPRCGADLVESPCGCQPVVADSPFAVLKDLLPSDEDS
jgi:uncharacterized protein